MTKTHEQGTTTILMVSAPLISATLISKELGGKKLFNDLSLVVHEQERVALIGPNGSGKSTLLKILARLVEPDSGEIRSRRDLSTAYVAQQDHFGDCRTTAEVLEKALTEASVDPQDIPRRISVYLGTCGFADGATDPESLSGGWRKRLAIARALAIEPELLLLDEPTNHLDIPSISWLEKCLTSLRCALLLVSHDRWFINRLAQRIIEIDTRYPAGTFESSGNYDAFLDNRAAFFEGLQRTQSALSNKVRREVEWLRQGVKARTTKSRARIDAAQRMIEDLKGMNLESERASLEFSASNRKTKELIRLEGIGVTLDAKDLFNDLTLTLSPGTRLAVVGPNGSGKSTFVATLVGRRRPDRGRLVAAPLLKTALFDQARRELTENVSLKETLCPFGDSVVFQGRCLHVAAWAARFMFSPNQLTLPIGSLSGGEQARALLARLMLTDADVLIFDEPTNDLDIATLEVLEEAFLSFSGAIVVVTHDRYLLERTSTMVLAIDGSRSGIFADYSQWERRCIDSDRRTPLPVEMRPGTTTNEPLKTRTKTKLTYQDQRELDGIEQAILEAESRVVSCETQISSPEIASHSAELSRLCAELATSKAQVEHLYERWQMLEEKKRALAKHALPAEEESDV
jgi:ATP-binding cassette subfamily F protein uup